MPQSIDQTNQNVPDVPVEVHPTDQIKPTDRAVYRTRERPDWSFVQILDQMLELTKLKPVSPGQLDKSRLMVKSEPT